MRYLPFTKGKMGIIFLTLSTLYHFTSLYFYFCSSLRMQLETLGKIIQFHIGF